MKRILTLLILVLAHSALAQPADTDPNGIGIYFDQGAGDNSWCISAPTGSQVLAYLCLTRASDHSGFTAWEATIEGSVEGMLAGFNIMGGGINSAIAPEFVVSYDTPLPYQLSTVLMEITVNVVWEWNLALRVWPAANPRCVENLPSYATVDAPGTFRPLQYPWGWDLTTETPNWCASINDELCIEGPSAPVDNLSWDNLKALYR